MIFHQPLAAWLSLVWLVIGFVSGWRGGRRGLRRSVLQSYDIRSAYPSGVFSGGRLEVMRAPTSLLEKLRRTSTYGKDGAK